MNGQHAPHKPFWAPVSPDLKIDFGVKNFFQKTGPVLVKIEKMAAINGRMVPFVMGSN